MEYTLANRLGRLRPLHGNRIEVLNDTNRTFGLILEAVRDATQTIHLEYYIWQPDETGMQLRGICVIDRGLVRLGLLHNTGVILYARKS